MRSPKRKGRTVKHTLADGTVKVYRYGPHDAKETVRASDSAGALIAAYQRSPEWLALAENTKVNYTIYLRPIQELAQVPVKEWNRRGILAMRDGIAASRGNGAATGFIRAASALFGWAVDREWIDHSPVHKIKPLLHGELRAWTRAEADHAITKLPEHLARVVILARYTGQRRGDLCAMRWVDYDGSSIAVTQQKTGAKLKIPAHPVLKAYLDAWDRRGGTILLDTNGNAWAPQNLSHAIPTALGRLGMPDDINVHGLRKLAAAELADAGCSTHEIASITGHKTLAMVEYYTRTASQERLASAAIIRLSGGGRDKDRTNRKSGTK